MKDTANQAPIAAYDYYVYWYSGMTLLGIWAISSSDGLIWTGYYRCLATALLPKASPAVFCGAGLGTDRRGAAWDGIWR